MRLRLRHRYLEAGPVEPADQWCHEPSVQVDSRDDTGLRIERATSTGRRQHGDGTRGTNGALPAMGNRDRRHADGASLDSCLALAGLHPVGVRCGGRRRRSDHLALAIAWPFIYRISARFHPLLFPLLTFGLTGMVVYLVGWADDGVEGVVIDSIWDGIWITLGLTIGNVFIGALFSLNDDIGYEWFVVRPLRRSYASTPKESTPGILFLEIDGLAEPILRQALDDGYMPTLKRWLDRGTHPLLAGSRTSRPRPRPARPASSSATTPTSPPSAGTTSRGQADGHEQAGDDNRSRAPPVQRAGLLTDGGASRWNVFSGDATDCLCTFSAVGDRKRINVAQLRRLLQQPVHLRADPGAVRRRRRPRAMASPPQVRRDERPRIHRQFKYAFIRASTTTAMQEASRFMLISDMFRGVPAVYNTFFAYDEVAHHSGIDRPDAFKVLTTLDRVFASLERAAPGAAPLPLRRALRSRPEHGRHLQAALRLVAVRSGQSPDRPTHEVTASSRRTKTGDSSTSR